MESLTKENFWNDLYAKYPKGVQVFCDWIDEYKKSVGWDKLFNTGKYHAWEDQVRKPEADVETRPVKYHDLPIAMQIGIWIEFVKSRGGCQWEIEDLFTYDWITDITEYIKQIHEAESD